MAVLDSYTYICSIFEYILYIDPILHPYGKWFVQHPMGQVWTKTTEIAVNNFVPRKDCRR